MGLNIAAAASRVQLDGALLPSEVTCYGSI
jgi:hypothetical protein